MAPRIRKAHAVALTAPERWLLWERIYPRLKAGPLQRALRPLALPGDGPILLTRAEALQLSNILGTLARFAGGGANSWSRLKNKVIEPLEEKPPKGPVERPSPPAPESAILPFWDEEEPQPAAEAPKQAGKGREKRKAEAPPMARAPLLAGLEEGHPVTSQGGDSAAVVAPAGPGQAGVAAPPEEAPAGRSALPGDPRNPSPRAKPPGPQQVFSPAAAAKVQGVVSGWFALFRESKAYRRLTEGECGQAEEVVMTFSRFAYSQLLLKPARWNPDAVLTVCCRILPSKISAPPAFFAAVAPVLEAFFTFLAQSKLLPPAAALASRVRLLGRTIEANAAAARERRGA